MQSDPKIVKPKKRLVYLCLRIAFWLMVFDIPFGKDFLYGQTVPWFAWVVFLIAVGLAGAAIKLGVLN